MKPQLRYYIVMTPDNKLATAWGTTREGALAAARVQSPDVEIVSPAYRWRWVCRLTVKFIRQFGLHDAYRQQALRKSQI
jgi:hypothetical protein